LEKVLHYFYIYDIISVTLKGVVCIFLCDKANITFSGFILIDETYLRIKVDIVWSFFIATLHTKQIF
jgi:hypothetical protein